MHVRLTRQGSELRFGWWEIHNGLAGAGDFLFGALRGQRSVEPQLVTLASVCEGYHRSFHDSLAIDAEKHTALTEAMLEAVQDDPEAYGQYERALRHANEMNQQQQLHHVLTRAGEVVEELGVKTGRLAEAVVVTRHCFVHHGDRDSRVITGGPNLWEANQLLILALRCSLLLDLGLTRGAAWPKS